MPVNVEEVSIDPAAGILAPSALPAQAPTSANTSAKYRNEDSKQACSLLRIILICLLFYLNKGPFINNGRTNGGKGGVTQVRTDENRGEGGS